MWLYAVLLLSFVVGSQCADNGADCLAKEKSLSVLELAKESIKKAKDLMTTCSNDSNSSACGKIPKAIAFLEITTDLITEVETNYPTCSDPESKPVIFPTEKPVILPTEKPVILPTEKPEILPTEKPVILPTEKPIDCTDVLRQGKIDSGVYDVWPKRLNGTSIKVYCDMDTDGGGWTVIQRKGGFRRTQDFNQEWEVYKNGFGDFGGEFWLGNEYIHMISKQGNYEVRFDLEDFEGTRKYAVYKRFWIADEDAKYTIHVEGYNGTAGDSMMFDNYHVFCTKDRPHGMKDQNNVLCTDLRATGWWYLTAMGNCNHVNINGLPSREHGTSNTKNMYWYTWKEYEGLAKSEMKMRRTSIQL